MCHLPFKYLFPTETFLQSITTTLTTTTTTTTRRTTTTFKLLDCDARSENMYEQMQQVSYAKMYHCKIEKRQESRRLFVFEYLFPSQDARCTCVMLLKYTPFNFTRRCQHLIV